MRGMNAWRMALGVGAAAFVVALSVCSPSAWVHLPFELLPVVLVLAGGAGWGAWLVVWLGQGARSGLQQVSQALTLGLGVLGVLTMAAGLCGFVTQGVGIGLVAAGWLLGVLRLRATSGLRADYDTRDASGPANGDAVSSKRWDWVGLASAVLLGVMLALGVFAALLPPGVLWQAEGGGYDVLEYHLQAPREYWDAGAIHMLGHNVYAQFPQQVESLYLLLMMILADPYAAAIPAQLLHLSFGAIAVVGVLAWLPRGAGRWVGAVAIGTTPWLAYVGALAYVELGLIAFAAAAGGLLAWCLARGELTTRDALAAGLLAGLAGGCKYTALVLVAVALGAALVVAVRGSFANRARVGAIFAVGVAIAFAPWAARGIVLTGNPVYPFAYEQFGGAAWSAEQAEAWAIGHALPEGERGLGARLARTARELFVGEGLRATRFGVGVWVAALIGLVAVTGRLRLWAGVWLVGIVAAWAGLTFMPGRFVVVLVVPAAVMVGWGVMRVRGRFLRGGFAAAVLAGGLVNVGLFAGALRDEAARFEQRFNAPMASMLGNTGAFVQFNLLRGVLGESDFAWLVGDAAVFYMPANVRYTVVWNRDPWVEHAVAGATAAESIAWLRERGVSHVVFNWSEIERLRGTYGFSAQVTRVWVAELEAAGLARVAVDDPLVRRGLYVIYRVRD